MIRSPWFKFIRARLPAPNQVPWKLLTVTSRAIPESLDPDIALLSLSRARLPIGMGGLQISDGFLPSGGTGNPRLGFGMVMTVRRQEVVRVLWRASQGGSRLIVEFGQLTPAGQAALKSAGLEGNSRLGRPLSGPWLVWLPAARAESDLAAWLR